MAGIDKTYTDSYEEYKEFKDWSKGKQVVFNYGKKVLKIDVLNYIYDWEKEDFNGRDLPVIHTPTWLDKYLYDNCPLKFILNRLKEVYDEDYLKNVQLNKISDNLKQNRKVVISKSKRTKFPLHNKGICSHSGWWLQEANTFDFDYNEDLQAWVEQSGNFPSYSNTMHVKTVKSLIRKLRKMYLPNGLEFRLIGRYVGEVFKVTIK
jgi:hypothetical protein